MKIKKPASLPIFIALALFAASCGAPTQSEAQTDPAAISASEAPTEITKDAPAQSEAPADTAADEPSPKETGYTVIYDHVLDIGTYEELDYAEAENLLGLLFDGQGMCSAAAVIDENGDMLVGRNLDLVVSDSPVYVYRTKADDSYETIGLTYGIYGSGMASIERSGIPDDLRAAIPFMANDVLNSEGLYIEMNMRYGEKNDKGKSKFGCRGTNPDSDVRVCAMALPQYVAQHCATVSEAVEYVKTLDIYSLNGSGFNWNLCFLIADANGNYGLLEMAENELSWLDRQPIQTNTYVTEKFAEKQDLKSGVGRYDLLSGNIGDVRNADDMFSLMNRVRYSLMYYPDEAEYDVRSEYVGAHIGSFYSITYDQITDEANADIVNEYINKQHDSVAGQTLEQMRKYEMAWHSVYTAVVNCSEKTVRVRFFEDDGFETTLSFDK